MRAYEEYADVTIINKADNQLLAQYFKVSYAAMTLFHQNFKIAYNNGKSTIKPITNGCTSAQILIPANYCLALHQWSRHTYTPTIADPSKNSTIIGYPEILNYYTSVFLPAYPDAKYQGITFSYEWAMIVMNYILEPVNQKDYVKTTSTLLNIGNLRYLYEIGEQYDASENDETLLQLIADRFSINPTTFTNNAAVDVALVFWHYTKYMVDIFAE